MLEDIIFKLVPGLQESKELCKFVRFISFDTSFSSCYQLPFPFYFSTFYFFPRFFITCTMEKQVFFIPPAHGFFQTSEFLRNVPLFSSKLSQFQG